LRLLVTGTRGKSALVRLLHSALTACGIRCYSRITGVIPRQLGPGASERPILRPAGGHVAEMRWWLNQLPSDAGAVVLENGAVSPELQPLAAHWLRPELVVLTNVRADHFEVWGPNKTQAVTVLLAGIPAGATVIAPRQVLRQEGVGEALGAKGCKTVAVHHEAAAGAEVAAGNLTLALAVCRHLGLARETIEPAMRGLAPDAADFRVMRFQGAELAFAFAANDPESAQRLFGTLGWRQEETRLVYNHRQDRPARLREFTRTLFPGNWRERLIVGDRPRPLPRGTRYAKVSTPTRFKEMFAAGDRVYGCGNVKGLPLRLLVRWAGR